MQSTSGHPSPLRFGSSCAHYVSWPLWGNQFSGWGTQFQAVERSSQAIAMTGVQEPGMEMRKDDTEHSWSGSGSRQLK